MCAQATYMEAPAGPQTLTDAWQSSMPKSGPAVERAAAVVGAAVEPPAAAPDAPAVAAVAAQQVRVENGAQRVPAPVCPAAGSLSKGQRRERRAEAGAITLRVERRAVFPCILIWSWPRLGQVASNQSTP